MLIDDRIQNDEGFRSRPFKDTKGIWTFGHGLTYITHAESAAIVSGRITEIVRRLADKYSWYTTAPSEVKDVSVEMVYQMGFKGFSRFKKTRAAFKIKDYKEASKQLLDSQWARSDSPARARRAAKRIRDIKS